MCGHCGMLMDSWCASFVQRLEGEKNYLLKVFGAIQN